MISQICCHEIMWVCKILELFSHLLAAAETKETLPMAGRLISEPSSTGKKKKMNIKDEPQVP